MYNKVFALFQEEYPEVDFTSSDELVDEGILDSLTLTGIIAALSMEFDIEIPYDEIIEENFNSVEAMDAMVERLQAQKMEELKKLGREDILVIAGGVIPAQDYDFLYKAGVAAIFGPGTSVAKAAVQIMEILLEE